MRDIARLTKQELIDLLKEIADQNNTKEDFTKAVKETCPGVAAVITYTISGPSKMFMGMASSLYHEGIISF